MASPLVPNLAQALQAGGQFGSMIAGNLRQGRMDEEKQKATAETNRILGQQRAVKNVASEANALLQIEDAPTLRNALIKRSQEVTNNPVDGVNAADFIDMANRLGDENGFNTVTQELRGDLARAQGIDAAISQRFGGDQANVQFGAQSTFKDEEGNIFFGTTRRNPNTGAVESVLASIDGTDRQPIGKVQQTGAFGQTASEKVTQIGEETTIKKRTETQEATRQDFIKTGLASQDLIPNTQRLLQLNKLISTGKTAKARKFFGDLFEIEPKSLFSIF